MASLFGKFSSRLCACLVCFSLAWLGLAAGTSVAGTTATVTSNPSMGDPYEVQVGQASTLSYLLTYKLGPNGEGVTPSVVSIVATFSVDNGGTIVQTGTSTYKETLGPGPSPVSLSCTAEGPKDGSYGVTCTATVKLSDGESINAGSAVDSFFVSAITVNISGPPYVIFDNSIPYDNAPVESKYTASAGGEPAGVQLSYQWSVSPNIDDLSSGATSPPNSIETDGATSSPTGSPGLIDCTVYQGVYPFISNGQPGTKPVTVHDEFTNQKSSATTQQDGTPVDWGQQFTVDPPGGSFSVEQGTSFSVTLAAGLAFNIGGGVSVPGDVTTYVQAELQAKLSASVTESETLSETMTQTVVVTVATPCVWTKTPVTDVQSGAAQKWGTSGQLGNYDWTDPSYKTTDWQLDQLTPQPQ